jgi:GNAT superfamily N-acetyltransferase
MNRNDAIGFSIRRASAGDEGIIVTMLRELAEFERLAPAFTLTEADVGRDLLGTEPVAVCDLAFVDGDPAGIALWFWSYRSFRAERGVFIEDLFVRPAFRGRGLGRMLLAHCARQGARLEWRVLDWNEKALAFYRGLGAEPLKDWLVYQLEGDALQRLAS